MDINTAVRDLGPVNMKPLEDRILALDGAVWREDEQRQKKFREVHYNTQSVILIFCDHANWPNVDLIKGKGWAHLADVAVPLMHDIIAAHYPKGGTIIRAMAARLLAGTHIDTHIDQHPSFHHGHRIHVPIATNPMVRFLIEGRPHRFEVGKAYEINNQKRHGVMNRGREDRIHFIFDYVPSKQVSDIPGPEDEGVPAA